LKDLQDRNARIKNSLAYCEPGGEPKIFESGCEGEIIAALAPGAGSFIDRIFIPHHQHNPQKKTMGEIRAESYEHFLDIWGDAELQFAKWLHSL
jgi:inosine/xanthosine triphosphate pyrophosphatase family protein